METILRFDYLAGQTQVGWSGHLLRANVCLRRSAFLKTSGLIGPIPNFRLWRIPVKNSAVQRLRAG